MCRTTFAAASSRFFSGDTSTGCTCAGCGAETVFGSGVMQLNQTPCRHQALPIRPAAYGEQPVAMLQAVAAAALSPAISGAIRQSRAGHRPSQPAVAPSDQAME